MSATPCRLLTTCGRLRIGTILIHPGHVFPEELEKPAERRNTPLAARMRPRTLDEVVGQQHILGPGKLLRRAIEADRIPRSSFTARPAPAKPVSPRSLRDHAIALRATERRRVQRRRHAPRGRQAANRLQNTGQKTILFIDEIHRFNKAQQDVLVARCREREGATDRRDHAQPVLLHQ